MIHPLLRFPVARLARALFLGACLVSLAGCGDASRPPGATSSGGVLAPTTESCTPGEQRLCSLTLDHSADIMTCFRGQQTCQEGRWSECSDGTVTVEAKPAHLRPRPDDLQGLAYSTPELCNASGSSGAFYNPCDPSCMVYFEDQELVGTSSTGSITVPDWSGPPGTATCTHGLCTTGVPLDATCHACVEKVCDVDATCCTGASADTWDTDCVNLVYTECGVEPPDPPVTLCDFAAFGDTSVRLGNGSTGYPAIGSNGWIRPETNARLGDVSAKGYVDLRNGASVTGNVVTESYVWVESPSTIVGNIESGGRVDIRNLTTVTGDVTAVGSIELQSDAVLDGNAWTGDQLILRFNSEVTGNGQSVGNMIGQTGGEVIGGNATVQPPSTIDSLISVTGTRSTAGPVETPEAPVVDLPLVSAFERDLATSCTIASGRTTINVNSVDVSLTPGTYGDVTVSAGRNLVLQPGSYVFQSLTFWGGGPPGARLSLAGSGPWDISLCGQWRSDQNMAVVLDGTTTPPPGQDLVIYSDQSSGDCIAIGDNNVLNGIFLAPKCAIRVNNNVTMTAALWGQTVNTDNNVNLTQIPKADCDGGNQWGQGICDGTTALYAPGYTYSMGARVHSAGNIYECDTPANCSAGGGYGGTAGYYPGEGLNWTSAWTLIGPCPDSPDAPSVVDECPVSLDIPDAPGPYEACTSGLDCQVNSRCTEVLTDASCAHDKCTVGPALADTCDPCVSMICAQYPVCCTNTGTNDWTASCVGLVESVCDASCGSSATGTCVDNGTSHQVASSVCADADLAVDISCDDEITVCNHGNTDVPAGEAVLTFFPRTGQQFAVQSPDPSWALGTCTVSSAISAGSCATETCDAALVDRDLTVFAQLSAAATVSECSTLDNWSYYVDANTCPSGGVVVDTQIYEAECPDDTYAYWGFLAWDTTLAGSANVAFEARSSSDGSFSGPFTLLGTAETTPTDTSVCSLVSSIADCPVDVAEGLWPGGKVNQDAFIELRMTLEAPGPDIPTVNDWVLTYSCVYDQ